MTLREEKNPLKFLEYILSYNTNRCIEENSYAKIKKVKTKLNLWISQDLTIYGKSLLAKALVISQLRYAASMLTVPESVIKTVQENQFKNRKDKIKRKSCVSNSRKRDSILLIFARLLNRYTWLGLVDF